MLSVSLTQNVSLFQWHHYGDAEPLKKHYDGLTDLMGYFKRRADPKTGLLLDGGYGDWVCVGAGGGCPRTPADSVSAFYFVQALGFLAEIAAIIGKPADAADWDKQHVAAVAAWHKKYYNSTLGTYSPCAAEPLGSQTSNAMALALGAPPDAATTAKVVARLVENIAANDGRFTFGIVGSGWLFPMLEKCTCSSSVASSFSSGFCESSVADLLLRRRARPSGAEHPAHGLLPLFRAHAGGEHDDAL